MTDPGAGPERVVRVLAEFFVLLEEQLPVERGPNGEPTVAEFAATDLLEIVDTFAKRWDELPMPHPGRGDYRAVVVTGHLVYAVSVWGQLSPVDGAIELIDIAIDLQGLDDDVDSDGDP